MNNTKKDEETDAEFNARMRKTYLQMYGQNVSNESLKEIFNYPSLKSLVLKYTRVDGKGLTTITNHPEISFLSLERSSIADGSLGVLSNMKSLYMLDISYTGVGDFGIRQLNNSRISFLNMTGTRLTNNSIPYIMKQFPNLVRLDLMSIPVTDDGIASLSGRKDMNELIEELKTATGGKETEFFTNYKKDTKLENRGLKNLIDLNIAGSNITEKGIAALSILKNIKILNLSVTPFNSDGLQHLRRMQNLEVLSLNGTSIGDSDMEILKDLSNLKVLSLENTGISDRGLKKLAASSSLFSIYLDNTLVTQNGIDKFLKKKPRCVLHHSTLNVSGKTQDEK